MFGRSEDIFEEEKPKREKVSREEKKQERLEEKEARRQEKEDARNAKFAAKATKTIEKVEQKSTKGKTSAGKIIGSVILVLCCLLSGVGAGYLVMVVKNLSFDILHIAPFAVSVDVFAFATAAYFASDKKRAAAGALVSFLALIAAIVFLARL